MEADRKGKRVVVTKRRAIKGSSKKEQEETPNKRQLLVISLSQLGNKGIKTNPRAKLRAMRISPNSSVITVELLDTRNLSAENLLGIRRLRSAHCKRSSQQLELRLPRVLHSKQHGRKTSPREKTS